MSVNKTQYDLTGHPYAASRMPYSGFYIRTPEAKKWRVANGRGKVLLDLLDGDGPLFGVEVGVNEGYLSQHLLSERLDLTLWMVDKWANRRGAIALGVAMNQTKFAGGRRIIHEAVSHQAAAWFPPDTMDFVFIDADHSSDAVRQDIELWRPKLKRGGLLCGHDYHMEPVKQVVDEMLPAAQHEDTDAVWWTREW